MKYSLYGLLLVTIVAFSSCKKTNSLEKADTAAILELQKELTENITGTCFDLVYPISYIMPDHSTLTINDAKELEAEIKTWYSTHSDSKEKPTLQFPIELVNEKGERIRLATKDDLEKEKIRCKNGDKEEEGKEGCFDLVYPVSYTMPDGTTITGEKEEAIEAALKAWYAAHPDSEAKPALQYPVDIIFEDGTSLPVVDEETMIGIKKRCEDKELDRDNCFELVYPVSYTMPNGGTITGETEEALEEALKAWYEAHPDSEAKPVLQYPVDIVFEDGSSLTVDSEEAMIAIKKRCEDKEEEACFEIIYPISYTMPDGTTITGDTKEAIGEALRAWYAAHPDVADKPTLQFPIDLVFEDGSILMVNDELALRQAYEDCK